MRQFVSFLIIGLVLIALIALIPRTGPAPSADATVRVLTADPIRVVLPIGAESGFIAARVREELNAAANRTVDPAVRTMLQELAGAEDVTDLARVGAEKFASREAAALAYPIYFVLADTERITISVATTELIPQLPTIAVSRDHEDGHALINSQLAQRCGPPLSRHHIEAGSGGAHLEAAIANGLLGLGTEAHELYHQYVQDAAVGAHRAQALRAVDETVTAGCIR